VNIGEAFYLLDKYNLRQAAEIECKRRKLDEAPYDMMGHNEVYAEFLDKHRIKLRDRCQALQEQKCTNEEVLLKNQAMHYDCQYNRFFFKKNGDCEYCENDKEISELQEEITRLSEASNIMKFEAQKDFDLR
jgi:hypothetical protein